MSFDKKTKAAMQALYDYAEDPAQTLSEIPEREIKDIITQAAGRGFAAPIFGRFYEQKFFQQVSSNFESGEGVYEFTEAFFRAFEKEADAPSNNHGQRRAPSYARFKDNLLIALKRKQDADGPAYRELKLAAEEFSTSYQKGWLRMAANEFDDSGYVKASFTMGGGDDGGMNCQLLGPGYEEAERLIEESELDSDFDAPDQSVPASDRPVKRSDNEPKYIKAVDQTASLLDELGKANDYGDLDEAEFQQRIDEVETIQILLGYPQVQWDILDAFAEKTLKFLAQKFADVAIGRAADILLITLHSLVF